MNKLPSPQLNILNEYEFEKTAVMAGITPLGEMIAIRPICENLGIDRKWQQDKIKSDPSIGSVGGMVKVLASDNKKYDMYCLPPSAFQEWLWSLSPTDTKMNVEVWESYKKGLVIHLLMMLKISLNEIVRLREVEVKYLELEESLKKSAERKAEIEKLKEELKMIPTFIELEQLELAEKQAVYQRNKKNKDQMEIFRSEYSEEK